MAVVLRITVIAFTLFSCSSAIADSLEGEERAVSAPLPINQLAVDNQDTLQSSFAKPIVSRGWQRMFDGFALSPVNNAVANEMSAIYSRNISFILTALQRSTPYVSQIIDNVRLRGMPSEIALLPVIESGYDPRALSPASAAGVWQFIPETGRRFGLRKTWLRDERLDPLAATDAALNYLQTLYQRYGDWHLALAAYNCGEGCVDAAVRRAIAAGRQRDFSGIQSFLPVETREYVPRLIAVSRVLLQYHERRGALPQLDDTDVVRILINQPTDIHSIARVAGMSFEAVATLNAGVLRRYVAEGDSVWITRQGLTRLKAKISQSSGDDERLLLGIRPEKAKAGEGVSDFAMRHQVTTDEIYRINGIPRFLSKIASGTLFVPATNVTSAAMQPVDAMEPLKMVGGDALMATKKMMGRDAALLAKHPDIQRDTGWVPGRLNLKGSKSSVR